MQRQDTTNVTKKLGKRIAAHRTSKRMSQEEYAKSLGISRGYLSDIERGVCEMSLETLAAVCKKTRTTSNQLLGF